MPGDGHLFLLLFYKLAVNSCSLRPKAGGGGPVRESPDASVSSS